MFFEDARGLTDAAIKLLERQKESLGCPNLKIWSLVDFSAYARKHQLTRRQKEIILDQAVFLLDQFYAHLPFKRARYATDPVQSLRLIRPQIPTISDLAFHEQILQTMVALRDAHTFYALPAPYHGAFAFLPFEMRCFRTGSDHFRYIVTKIIEDFDHQLFTVDAEITSWNGVPIEQAVEREGLHDVGANPSARRARSINRMSSRPLALTVPPSESFAVVGYKPAKGTPDEFGIVIPWYICTNGIDVKKRRGTTSSLNESMAQTAQARRVLFHRDLMSPVEPPPNLAWQSKYPDVFSFQYSGSGFQHDDQVDRAALHDPDHPEKKFGYIRIRTFDLDESAFVDEFQRLVTLMQQVASDGLILDVRSNPGGSIQAAELSLQFLTPDTIQPANFHLIGSQTTQRIALALKDGNQEEPGGHQLEWQPWVDDLLKSIANGDVITPGQPLTNPGQCREVGQIYQGPITLIIDSLAYSATDIFAGGFQDHKIGQIIGVDENTGGGGANRWLYEELCDNLRLHGLHDLPMEPLPAGAELGIAIRRCSRVAGNHGVAIEDEGVKADIRHHVTRDDLLQNDRDLLSNACKHLASLPTYLLQITKAQLTPDSIDVTIISRNLYRLECLVNGPFNQAAFLATGGEQSFKVPIGGLVDPAMALQINGFVRDEHRAKLVATAKLLIGTSESKSGAATASG